MSEIERFSMTDPEVARCPFGYYAAMRRKHTVHRDPGTGFYWISTYDAVVRAAMDAQTFSSQSEVILKKRYRPRAQACGCRGDVRARHARDLGPAASR
jgi:cytochrome P450